MDIVWFILLLILFLILLEIWRSAHTLSTSQREIFLEKLPDAFDGFKICHLSDFHMTPFVENDALEAAILKQSPDAIFVTGDILDCTQDRYATNFFSLVERLEGKFPIYCSLGNHEMRVGHGKLSSTLRHALEDAGVVVLDNDHIPLCRNGEKLWLYGYLQEFSPLKKNSTYHHARLRQDVTEKNISDALGPCPKDAPVILLAHDPYPFESYAQWGAALVLSGHIHGGVVRLPLLGGLLSPDRKLFPKYDCGHFYSEGGSSAQLYLSRGLGNSSIPRFFDSAEAAFLTLRPAKIIGRQ